jgi:hypothetical protein
MVILMNKPEAEAILEPLRDKTLSFGCEFTFNEKITEFDKDFPKRHIGQTFIFITKHGFRCREGNVQTADIKQPTIVFSHICKLSGIVSEQLKVSFTECGEREDKLFQGITVLGHPILIGDVLEKMKAKNFSLISPSVFTKLVSEWYLCGYSKSLQEIVESGWEEVDCNNCRICVGATDDGERCPKCRYPEKVLKPEVEALLEFIKSLNLK